MRVLLTSAPPALGVLFRADWIAYFFLSVSVDGRASSGDCFSDVLAASFSPEFSGRVRCKVPPPSPSPLPTTTNNNNTIWRGTVLTGEEPPPHSGELSHALSHVGCPTQSQLSRPTSSGYPISVGHRLRRKHLWLNCDTFASNEMCLKETQRKKKKLFALRKTKNGKKELKNRKAESP